MGAGTKEESGEIWTLVTLRRLPLVTTRPQHHPGVGVAGLLMARAQLERSRKKRMPPLGCTSPPPQPRNPGRIPRLNRDGQPPGGGRGCTDIAQRDSRGWPVRFPMGSAYNSKVGKIGDFYGAATGQFSICGREKWGYKPYAGHFLPLCQTKLILCNPNNAAAAS